MQIHIKDINAQVARALLSKCAYNEAARMIRTIRIFFGVIKYTDPQFQRERFQECYFDLYMRSCRKHCTVPRWKCGSGVMADFHPIRL